MARGSSGTTSATARSGRGPGADSDLAAIDLGSNSFHMVVARLMGEQLVIVDRIKEMVMLGAGLNEERLLTKEGEQRALACLERFGQRVRGLPQEKVRAVGTNTLRMARNSESFLERSEEALGHPIEVISGIEEARLIYLGVAHGLGRSDERRLVVDIGGGSTELVVGQDFAPLDLESLYVGCVPMMKRHFPDGRITAKRFRRAEVSVLQELERVEKRFRRLGWKTAIGTSGTIRAVTAVIHATAPGRPGITREALKKLRASVIDAETIDRLAMPGLNRTRAAVFPGGVAILAAIFESLELDQMEVSQSALREGLLNDLLGRLMHRDVRTATVLALMERYHVEKDQADRVERTVLGFLPQVMEAWGLPETRSMELCTWAARLHEIGLDIAHSHYHKHGAYVLENADLPGFTVQEQRLLATLVRAHRRKLPTSVFRSLPAKARLVEHLAVLLRLSVLLHRSRSEVPELKLSAARRKLEIRFPPGWLEAHPLTAADLLEEIELLRTGDFELRVQGLAQGVTA